MGKPTGFLEIPRETADAPAGPRAHRTISSKSITRSPTTSCAPRARGAWTAASRSATRAARSGNLIPDWNDLVYRDQWRAGDRAAARDQQLPRVHRQALPGPVRSVVRAGDQQRPGRDQADRGEHHRPGLGRGLGRPAAARVKTGKTVASSAPARPAWPCAQQLARAGHSRHGLRARRPDRRLAPLRHPRLQDGEALPRPPARPDGGRGSRLPAGVERRRRRHGRRAARPTSTPSASAAGRPSRATCRSTGASSTASTSRWISSPRQNRRVAGDAIDDEQFISARDKHVIIIGGGDTGADCLGTVHRQGCQERPPVRDRAPAARQPAADQPLAPVVQRLPRLVGPRRRGRPRILDQHQAVPGRERPGHVRSRPSGSR